MDAQRRRMRYDGWAAIESRAVEVAFHEACDQQDDSSASAAVESHGDLSDTVAYDGDERSFTRILSEQKQMMSSLASEQFRLLQFAKLTMDVFLSVASVGPPQLHVSPLVLQILLGTPSDTMHSPAHAAHYAQRGAALLVDVEATRQAALRTAEDPIARTFSFKLRAANGGVVSVTAPLLSSCSSKRGSAAILAGVSNVMESACLLASNGVPLEQDSLLFRASCLHSSRVAQQVAAPRA